MHLLNIMRWIFVLPTRVSCSGDKNFCFSNKNSPLLLYIKGYFVWKCLFIIIKIILTSNIIVTFESYKTLCTEGIIYPW